MSSDEASANRDLNPNVDGHRLKLIEYLTKRLDHTLSHTQTSTKLIYLVNGAIIAFVYFEFGIVRPMAVALGLGAILIFLLAVINGLHANFIRTQHFWYKTIDQQVWKVFIGLSNFETVCPKYLGDAYEELVNTANRIQRPWPFRRTHQIYMWIHLVLTVFLLLVAVLLAVAAVFDACGKPLVEFKTGS